MLLFLQKIKKLLFNQIDNEVDIHKLKDLSNEDEDSQENDSELQPPTEEEQHLSRIKELIISNDISNHQLASMLIIGLELQWDEEMYQSIAFTAEKMIFWAEQERNEHILSYYNELVIGKNFFSRYAEIAQFAAILHKFRNLEQLTWKAKHYWNQHPILIAAATLPKLRILSALDCRMNFLPEAICNAQGLEQLFLSGNKLNELPESIEKLRNLKVLDLSSNQFDHCPVTISKLSKLEILKINANPLKDLNLRLLGRLYKLKDLELPQHIVKNHFSNIKDWMPDLDYNKPYWNSEC